MTTRRGAILAAILALIPRDQDTYGVPSFRRPDPDKMRIILSIKVLEIEIDGKVITLTARDIREALETQ